MITLLRKLMNGIITLFDNMNCSIGCCSNTINVTFPPICSECSKKSFSSLASIPHSDITTKTSSHNII